MRRSLVTVIVVASLLLVSAIWLGPFFGFIVARVEGHAMSPTLQRQDRLIVNSWSYVRSSPRRGDIIMLRYPRDRSQAFVHRIIGVGGDSVWMEGGQVFVNGRRLDEPYVDTDARTFERHGPVAIPARHYFVLGDRRDNSSDSRDWGLLSEDDVVGRVALRWWPNVRRL